VGKLHAGQGRSARAMTSRWSTEKDKNAFAGGYLEAYAVATAHRNGNAENSLLVQPKTIQ
jgi:hypothetical protein